MEKEEITMVADVIIEMNNGEIVLGKRKHDPFQHQWGLPGGKMEGGETIEEAAVREVKEETNLTIKLDKIVGVFSKPNRDPRGRLISVCFTAKVVKGELKAGSDAEDVMTTKNFETMKLAFDHNEILKKYIKLKQPL